ncbi:MAG: ribosomal protein S18-alanine N-acetyltransferase [Dehalococcoidales bacterium]|nr:ribosomal protein S18-alanine N-acetyltransferase [Dehalococcoidales bacterium]
MTYSMRRMDNGDLGQVQDIDREAFPTQWPAPNYRQELANKLAHYIILCDDDRRGETPPNLPGLTGTSFVNRLLPWRKPKRVPVNLPATPTEEYIIGFSGIWVLVDEAHITNLAVREEYQGRGLGEHLLIATFDMAADLHITILTLEVRVSNTVAQSLYAKYGFADKGVRKGYYLDNREDALIMTSENITSEESRARLAELRKSVAAKLAM